MRNRYTYVLLLRLVLPVLLGMHVPAIAQTADTTQRVLSPWFSLGTGMLAFYGDVGNNSATYSPLVSRIGYDLKAGTAVTPWLEVGLQALHGRLSVNERSATRNLNFESRITTGGLYLQYNFHHLLKPGRPVEPFVNIGFSTVEYLSKTDLYDAQGRRYNYWSDGTIRDLPENASNAADAKEIYRDYSYETDVRELNAEHVGRYNERSFSIPVGIGARMLLGRGIDLRFSTTMHFTRTDHIDGAGSSAPENRSGNNRMDRFLYSGVSIGYAIDLNRKKNRWKSPLSVEETDAIALYEDQDGDGVPDINDKCPNTPPGVPVDAFGCPLDGDGDGVPDYRDDELDSAPGAFVNQRGVTISDADMLAAWLAYLDSGNVNFIHDRVESGGIRRKVDGRRGSSDNYVVRVGIHNPDMTEDFIQRMLSLPDVRAVTRNDSTFYIVGAYPALADARSRGDRVKTAGFEGRVMRERDGKIYDVDPDTADAVLSGSGGGSQGQGGSQGAGGGSGTGNNGGSGSGNTGSGSGSGTGGPELNEEGTVIRVQLGAFRKPLGKSVFRNVPDLVTILGNDGLTRYYTGSFTNVNDAARRKVDMAIQGFKGSFLVAFKDGKRVSMKEAGAQVTGVEDINSLPATAISRELIRFRVQVATFAGNVNVPQGDLQGYGDVKPVPSNNSVRYLYGDYPTRAAAELARKELQNLGFEDAFVVGEMNGHIITADDAEHLRGDQ